MNFCPVERVKLVNNNVRYCFRVVTYKRSLLYVIENPLTSSQFHLHSSLRHRCIDGFCFTHFSVSILPILGEIVPFSSSDLKLLRQPIIVQSVLK
ncbi:hypothetical protein L1887_35214 [Cichorium endivia]|nr:hypothetical protein L1887_35214 [Cichorium endivia]